MQKSSALRKSVSVLAAIIATLCAPALSRAALVAAWGDNAYGQTRLPVGVNNVKAIAGGEYHSLALRSDGSVVAWGLNNQGQINVPSGLANVKAIAAGGLHSLALEVNGSVVAWGSSYYGLTNVPGMLSRVTAIACGALHNLALQADGTVITWGDNYYGQTNIPAGLSDAIAIAAGANHSLALKADGSVVAWGYNSYGQTNVPSDLSNVVAIATRGNFNLALKADGTVVAWGQNQYGQSNVPPGLSNVTALAAGVWHAMALTTDGTVVAWGDNSSGQLSVPSGLSNVTAIAAGGYHGLALVPEGPVQIVQNPQGQGVPYTSNVTFSVVAAGREPISYRWLFNGSPISPNPRVSGTTNATLTITNLQFSDIGTYAAVVSNAFGSVISSGASLIVISPPFITQQPTDRTVRAGSDVIHSAAASGTPPLLYHWNFNGTDIPGATNSTLSLTNVQPAASGGYYMKVTNAYGFAQTLPAMLTVTDSPPYILRQPTNQVAPVHGGVTFAVDVRGSLPLSYQWRFNGVDVPNATNTTLVLSNLRYDQIGIYNVEISSAFGTTNSVKVFLNVAQVVAWGSPFAGNTNTPVGFSNVIAIAAGGSHITALKADGTVKTWLANAGSIFGSSTAITNAPASATNVIAIAAGRDHSLGLRSNGTVVAWGGNSSGQITVPFSLSNVVAVAAGSFRSFAVRADGTVAGWGSQATVPSGLSNVVAIAAGPSHALALLRDGTVRTWGSPSNLTNMPAGLSNVIALAASSLQNLALKQDGTVVIWGSSLRLSDPSNVVAIATSSFTEMALKQDGSVISTGFEKGRSMPTLSNVTAIAVGGVEGDFGVAVLGEGSPGITLQPGSQTVQKGATVQLHARAAGVQPMNYQWQLENQNLPGATNASLLITNAQGKDTGNYRIMVSNPLGTVASRIATLTIPYNTNLGATLNTNNWQWSNERTTSWFAQIRETHDSDVAAQSGAISNNQQSVLQTTISGPGTLTFWWKVSSEESFDFLRFYLDGTTTPLASISGENDWEQKTFIVPTGVHTLRWAYAKDISVSAGRDAGWLDEVVFTPDPPVITLQPTPPSTIASMRTNVTIRVTATGLGPLSYQWLKNGAMLTGATQSNLTLTNVTRRNSGTYAVRVSNPGGNTLSSNATLVVRVPQHLQAPVRLADGTFLLTSGDADGGALVAEDLAALKVEASTNLVNWVTLPGVAALTNGSLVMYDPGSTNFPVRFYRMVEH